MADIFISYASEDRARAEAVSEAFRALGWTVWWDDQIAPGKRFDRVIEAELNQARCVVVLWSEVSVRKEWVLEEASAGKEREVLLPALIADVALPLGFKRVQAANLVDWTPGKPHGEFEMLVASIEQMAPRPQRPAPPLPSPAVPLSHAAVPPPP